MPGYSFSRDERLKSKRLIDSLFANGKGGFVYPVRYVVEDHGVSGTADERQDGQERQGAVSGVRVLVSVSKRYHKRAVARNLLKRRIREAYRLNKQPLEGRNLSIGLLYSSNDILEYKVIEDAVRKIIAKISEGD